MRFSDHRPMPRLLYEPTGPLSRRFCGSCQPSCGCHQYLVGLRRLPHQLTPAAHQQVRRVGVLVLDAGRQRESGGCEPEH